MTYNELREINDKNKAALKKRRDFLDQRAEILTFQTKEIALVNNVQVELLVCQISHSLQHTINLTIEQLVTGIIRGDYYLSNIARLKYDISKLDVETSITAIIAEFEKQIVIQKQRGYGEVFFTELHGTNAYLGNKMMYEKVRDYFLVVRNYMVIAKPKHSEGSRVVEPSEYIVWDLSKLK